MSRPRDFAFLAALLLAAACSPTDGRDATPQATPATTPTAVPTTIAPAAPANAVPSAPASVPATASTTSAATPAATAGTREHTGWYVLKDGAARFQPCGATTMLRIGQGADLAERARGLALEDDTPVYVRLVGTQRGDLLDVATVAQFGASSPVDDCPMEAAAPPEAR